MPYRRNRLPIGFPRTRPGKVRRGGFKILPLILFAAFAFYFYTSNLETVPLTGRSQLVDISRSEEVALGLDSYQKILSGEAVVNSGEEVRAIRQIGARLISVIESPESYKWEFNLIDSEQANAFCLPGGKVAVYSGILPIAKNTDGMAIIIGHEIAHAIARHGAERMTQQKLQQYGQIALGLSTSEMSPAAQQTVLTAFGLGAQYGVMMPFSRKHESEADYMGLIFAARACFDPQEAPKVWERMSATNKRTPPEFLSTHPDPANRIRQFQEWMPEAMKVYNEYCL